MRGDRFDSTNSSFIIDGDHTYIVYHANQSLPILRRYPTYSRDNHQMARGRPPLPRTEDEALKARRDQVRKNVQAYRRRKHEQCERDQQKSDKNQMLKSHGFEPENPGQLSVEYLAQPSCAQSKGKVIGSTVLNRQQCKKPPQRLSQDYHFPFFLPQEVNAAQMSLQQFECNAVSAFVPSCSSAEIGPHWSQMMPSLVNTNHTLDLSIQAICLMQMSYVTREHHLINSSISLYSRALRRLRNAIAKPSSEFSFEIFAATLTLSAYELLQGNTPGQGHGWMFHVEGATSYLNKFQSIPCETSASRQISFHFLETICIFDALGARRPSPFSTTKRWQNSVDQFSDEVYGALLRVVTTLPTILEQSDEAAKLSTDVEAVATWQRLVDSCVRLETALAAWFERTKRQIKAFRLVAMVLTQEMGTHTDIGFPNLYIARLYLLYWSSLILLLHSMATLQRKLDSSTLGSTTVTLLGPRERTSQTHSFALNVSRSVHYCLQPRHGLVGKSVVLLPLWVITNFFRDCGDVEAKAWCDGVLEGLGQRDLSFGLGLKQGK